MNSGGTARCGARRDADLYVYADIDELYLVLKGKVDLNETFYGNREFTIRDIDGFWLTFGSAITVPEKR